MRRGQIRATVTTETGSTITRSVVGHDNDILSARASLNGVIFDISGNRNRIEINPGSQLSNVTFYIRGDDHTIVIGSGCILSSYVSFVVEDDHCHIHVGDRTAMYGYTTIAALERTRVEIGNDCLFAYNVEIRSSDSHSILDVKSKQRLNPAKDIGIGNHVWIGSHAIVLKGATIHDDSIVAAGAVVTKLEGEKGVIIAGNPARIIRRNVTWTHERNYRKQETSVGRTE